MGFQFSLADANIVAYLTTSGNIAPPRFTWGQIDNFLHALEQNFSPRLISQSSQWIEGISKRAGEGQALARLHRKDAHHRTTVEGNVARSLLANLKPYLAEFDLFALGCHDANSHSRFDDFAKSRIYERGRVSELRVLFLMPTESPRDAPDGFSLLDPFPAIAEAAEHPENWPGVLFWLRSGISAFAPENDAARLFDGIIGQPLEAAGATLKRYKSPKRRSIRILHLSDLHFGTEEATANETYVLAHLRGIAPKIDRVTITGDLCQNPDKNDARAFRAFRANLFSMTRKPVVVIPGNHDQKWSGIGADELGVVANLEWSNVEVDYQLKCVFLCFDSSRDAVLARGKVTRAQLLDVTTEYETHCAADKRIRKFLPIALLHHHPHSFQKNEEPVIDTSWWEKAMRKLRVPQEPFLAMEDAPHFLKWCAGRKIPLILHGHKHLQRHVEQSIETDATTRETFHITSIGCGTTLGAEGKPLTYNLLIWNPRQRRWIVSFYADPGDGSGFVRQKISVNHL